MTPAITPRLLTEKEGELSCRAVPLSSPDLAGLAARVAAATGPDRELDLWLTALLWDPWPNEDFDALKADIQRVGVDQMYVERPFTASIDASLALVERVLPEAVWEVQRYGGEWRPGYRYAARVARPYSGKDDHENGRPRGKGDVASTPALALLSALLAALIAKESA